MLQSHRATASGAARRRAGAREAGEGEAGCGGGEDTIGEGIGSTDIDSEVVFATDVAEA
jgi:hypothetical protein